MKMHSHCPSQDWDRYCAWQEGPVPVGKAFVGKSRRSQQCTKCYGEIPANTPHTIQFVHDEEGHFISPDRVHLPPQCRTFLEQEYLDA
jgi:hypothetical protein